VLPTALLIWVIMLWLAGIYMERMAQRLPEPKPIEAQLIELPQAPPPEVQRTEPELPKEPVPITKKIIAKPKPVIERSPSPPETPPPQPSVQTEPPPPAPQEPTKPAPVVQSSTVINGGNVGARAIFQPKPKIPDELREEALNAIAIARFHIATDGTATVELLQPTNNPRINQLLLNTLKSWRFFPALAGGKPVASTQDLRIHLEIN
jgi:protein TonB